MQDYGQISSPVIAGNHSDDTILLELMKLARTLHIFAMTEKHLNFIIIIAEKISFKANTFWL